MFTKKFILAKISKNEFFGTKLSKSFLQNIKLLLSTLGANFYCTLGWNVAAILIA